MKNIIDFILESRGQRISKRASNRPYDVNADKLLKKRDSRPERAQQLRETKLDKQVQEFCSTLVNDFMVKFYNLTKANDLLLSFDYYVTDPLEQLEKDNALNDIKPETKRNAGGCVFLRGYELHDGSRHYNNFILMYKSSDSFTTILNNLKINYYSDWDDRHDMDNYRLYLTYNRKFLSSVLHKLRKHDLAKKVKESNSQHWFISLFDLFNDLSDNYNKNYFADKFKEFETAYNDVLANW